MIKTSIVLLCGMTSVLGMDSVEKLEFMRNGRALAATMTQQQKLEFMRNGNLVVKKLYQMPIPLQEQVIKANSTSPVPIPVAEQLVYKQPEVPVDIDPSIEQDLINYAVNLSLNEIADDESESNSSLSSSSDDITESEPKVNINPVNVEKPESIKKELKEKIKQYSGKNVIINYNITINQKLKKSSQNINIGKNNNNL